MSTWKNVERQIAKILGGERVPITGRQRGSAPDIALPEFGIEVKHRKRLPGWIADAVDQAVACTPQGGKPVVILHEAGQRYADSYVILKLTDFQELINATE